MALAIALAGIPVLGQEGSATPFVGMLHFEVTHDSVTMPLRYYSNGRQLRIELGKEGQPSRIWIMGLEELEGVVAISPIKMSYTLETNREMRPRGSRGNQPERSGDQKERPPEMTTLPEADVTELMGLPCRRYLLKTEGPNTELWVLENAQPFPMAVMGMWSGLRDAMPQVSQACREANGLPLQVLRKNWRGKELFAITLKSVNSEVPGPELFTIPEDYFRTRTSSRMGGGGSRSGERPSGGGGRPGGGGRGSGGRP